MDIIEAIEGPIFLNVCLNSQNECAQASFCPAYPVWVEAQNAIATVLRGASIEQLARKAELCRPTGPVRLEELSRE